MADFLISYHITSKHEGGYANDSDDYGKETYRGISRRYHPTWEGWVIIDKVKKVKELKRNEFIDDLYLDKLVINFYKIKFWLKYKCDLIHDQKIANIVYDGSVLMGVTSSILLQKALNDLNQNVVIDGQIGPMTAAAIIRVNRTALIDRIIERRINFHKNRVILNPKQKKFLKGWSNRAKSFKI